VNYSFQYLMLGFLPCLLKWHISSNRTRLLARCRLGTRLVGWNWQKITQVNLPRVCLIRPSIGFLISFIIDTGALEFMPYLFLAVCSEFAFVSAC